MGLTVDPTINLGQLITILLLLGTIGKMFLGFRDMIKQHTRDIRDIKWRVDELEDGQEYQYEHLITKGGMERRVRIRDRRVETQEHV